MRPKRKAAVRAAEAVTRPLSPSPMSSEEGFNSGLEDMDTGDNEIFSDEEQDEIEEDEDIANKIINDNLEDDLESLSEQEPDMEEDEENLDELQEDDEEEEEEDDEDPIKPSARNMNKRKKQISESDDEEEIFSDEGEVVRNKPMTKRQRAKVFHETPEEYLELPMDTGKKKHLTEEEEQLKRSEVARRRKNQSIQRAEKDKADTINRLLKKQASKTKRVIDETEEKETAHEKLKRLEDPNRLRYLNTPKGSQLSIPSVYSISQIFGEHTTSSSPSTLPLKQCQAQGCSNIRKYTAAKSGKYACSLAHYKQVESQ